MLKRYLSRVLILCMLVAVMPISVFAQTSEQSKDPVVPSAAEVDEESTPYATQYVAKIGTKQYRTLSSAISAAKDGDTVELIADTTENSGILPIFITKDITIDLGGHTATLVGLFIKDGNVTIQNGTVIGTKADIASAIQTYEPSLFLILLYYPAGDIHLTLNNVNAIGARHALRVEGGDVEINGGSFSLSPSGSTHYALNVGSDDASVESSVVVNSGTFTGPRGIDNAGGSALYVYPGADVEINGGDFRNGGRETLSVSGNLAVQSGTFDTDPSKWVKEGNVVEKSEDGIWQVYSKKYAACIGSVKYETLEEALAAAADGDTVTLLLDALYRTPFLVTKQITLDLNGKTLAASYVVFFKGADIIDSSISNTGLLQVAKDQIALDEDNAQLPVWNGEGFVFTEVKFQEKLDQTATGGKKFTLLPLFEEHVMQLIADGALDNGIAIVVRLQWSSVDADGKTYYWSQDCVFDDELVPTVYLDANTDGKPDGAFSLALGAADIKDITDMTFETVIVSDYSHVTLIK